MKLDKDVLLEYTKKSFENAQELFDEGDLLLKEKRYARAFTLFQLSIEEVGASMLILESILSKKYEKRKGKSALLRMIRNHKVKTKYSQKVDLLLAYIIPDEKLKKVLLDNVIKQSGEIDKINKYKNKSLYVFLSESNVAKPSEAFNESLVDDFKFYAKIRLGAGKQFHDELVKNIDGIIEGLQKIKPEDFIENPPEKIKQLVTLIKNA